MRETELHVASCLVHVRPDAMGPLAAWLGARPGCEVSGRDPNGKLVVVMESDQESGVLALIDAIETRPGVLSAALVYHEVLDPTIADEPQEVSP